MTAKRLCRIVIPALVAVLVTAAAALADADPASDVLLGANVFYPYSPAVSGELEKMLNAETAAAGRAHFPIKVALIESPTDLGAIPNFFDKPGPYAQFLDEELSFLYPDLPLLVVMPDGYGFQGLPPGAAAAAKTLPKLGGTQSNDLARAAISALPRLAAAAGHPIPGASASSAGASGSGTPMLPVIGLGVAAVAAAAAITAIRRRLRPQNR